MKLTYNDTINYVFMKGTGDAHLTAFSISQIAGAFCDDGQNYKNIILGIKGMGVKFTETTVDGCRKSHSEF